MVETTCVPVLLSSTNLSIVVSAEHTCVLAFLPTASLFHERNRWIGLAEKVAPVKSNISKQRWAFGGKKWEGGGLPLVSPCEEQVVSPCLWWTSLFADSSVTSSTC